MDGIPHLGSRSEQTVETHSEWVQQSTSTTTTSEEFQTQTWQQQQKHTQEAAPQIDNREVERPLTAGSLSEDSEEPRSSHAWETDTVIDGRQTNQHSTIMDEADTQEMRRIATALSRRESTVTRPAGAAAAAFNYDTTDETLQPDSPHFDPSKWLRLYLAQLEDEGIKPMRLEVLFKDLSVSGTGSALQLQETVGSAMSAPLRPGEFLNLGSKAPRKILHKFDGMLRSGELLVVLGRPGSGCSTFLKTLCGELQGLNVDSKSDISFSGIPSKQMSKEFKGEVIYNQEVDKHFPHLTVGQTLEFAAAVRTRKEAISGMSHAEYCKLQARVAMAICGLSHTYNTKVGDDFVRGVSGGERKRVSIAEMILAGSPFAAWDNRYVFFFIVWKL